MDALFSQLSLQANEALDKNFDPNRIDQLLKFFMHEAHSSQSSAVAEHQKAADEAEASMREAEDQLNSLLDSAMSEYYKTFDDMEGLMNKKVKGLVRAANAAEKTGQGLGYAAKRTSEKYMDAAHASGVAAIKKVFAAAKINKVHPS